MTGCRDLKLRQIECLIKCIVIVEELSILIIIIQTGNLLQIIDIHMIYLCRQVCRVFVTHAKRWMLGSLILIILKKFVPMPMIFGISY
ncbi:hypothetical protein AFK67_13130 [Cronobacter dublinensis subsp. dublinensis LMG 23823]|nr:hypothetical protein AFK67_13130 [Cronobacter dublinensis subsp. dublinensis LMG 23823]